ncbi:MAG: LON peptidase substrate-binding domain-containing protein [Pseudomonadota bacterium]
MTDDNNGGDTQDDAAAQLTEIPLFPLGTVLFSGGQLPLRIFEPRYVDMIGRCAREQSGFGVLLLRTGSEVRKTREDAEPDIFRTGTEAIIEDFNTLSDGMLGVVARGRRKLRVRATRQQTDGLLLGSVEFLPEEKPAPVDERFVELVELLRELVKHPMIEKLSLSIDFDDARSVGWRLAELLPIEAEIKQSLLQMQMPRERLVELVRIVGKLKG